MTTTAQTLPNFTDVYGTQLTNTNGQWVTINPAQPNNIDLIETRIFKMPQKGSGVSGIEFKLQGADGGTAWANAYFSRGGGGGFVQFTLDLANPIHQDSWFMNRYGFTDYYSKPFLLTFGKKGESKPHSGGFYTAAGGGGSTGMSWLLPSKAQDPGDLNTTDLIAAAGGGSGGFSFIFGSLHGNSAINNAVTTSVPEDYDIDKNYAYESFANNVDELWIVSGGSLLGIYSDPIPYCCSPELKMRAATSLPYSEMSANMGYIIGQGGAFLTSLTYGQRGGQPVAIFSNAGESDFTGIGTLKSVYTIKALGGKGGAGFGGGGAGASTTSATDIRFNANDLPTSEAGGTGALFHTSNARIYPNAGDSGWNNYNTDFISSATTGSRVRTDSPQSGSFMYRTIADTEKPQINLNEMTVSLKNRSGPLNYFPNVTLAEAIQPYLDKPDGLWDNDAIASVTASVYGEPLTRFECYMTYAGSDIPADITVTDVAGNSTTQLVMIKVIDPFKPEATSDTSPKQISVDDGPVKLTAAHFPTPYDGCKGSNGVVTHFTATTFYCNDAGEHSVQYYYTDLDGNNSETYTKTFTVVCNNTNTGGDGGTEEEGGTGEDEDTGTNTNQRYIYVDHTAQGDNDGSSWTHAFTSLQDALTYSFSNPATAIYVAKGTYYPSAVGDRVASFTLYDNAKLYGGFPNGGGAFRNRNPDGNPTILSGKISDTENSYHVVSISGNNAHLEGFTIRDGKADYDPSDGGGGLYLRHFRDWNTDYATTVRNCRFINNYGNSGGAVSIEYQNNNHWNFANFVNCEFTDNSTGHSGGAVYVKKKDFSARESVRAEFVNCLFNGNNAVDRGGALAVDNSSIAYVTNCTFSANNSSGGTVYVRNLSIVRLRNSILFNDSPNEIETSDYGVVYVYHSNIQGSGGSGPGWAMGDFIQDFDGNIDADPLFRSSPALSIGPESPCYNAGNNDFNTEPYDIYGKSYRISDGVIDMGAFETGTAPVFVAADAPAGGDGGSWATAFNNLHDGINAAGVSQTVWIKEGTYRPDRRPGYDTSTPANRDNSYYINTPLKIYGGFAGTETSLAERNIGQHPVILSGDIGTLNDAADNTYHVVTIETEDALLDGIIVQDGNADDRQDGNKQIGAGVFQKNGKTAVITNSVFRHNYAREKGAAWYAQVNQPGTGIDFAQSLFYGNTANRGAAFYLSAGGTAESFDVNFYSITAYGNTSSTSGAGAFEAQEISGAQPTNLHFYNSLLAGNTPENYNDSGNPGHITLTNSISAASATGIFENPSNPAGADGKIMTPDDGLKPGIYSPAISYGDAAWLYNYNGKDKDIAGNPRIVNNLDAGAYESTSYYAPLTADGQGIIYVRPIASGDGTGSSWENATSDLHNAIHANGVQKVFVAIGNYNVGDHSFIMKNGVEIYGGFDPGNHIRTLNDQRIMPDPTNNSPESTVLNGQSVRPVIWNIFTSATAMDATAVLDGFMLVNGRYTNGGGVRNVYASPTFRNVVIHNNRATLAGGGMYNQNSSPILTNVIINNNGIDALLNPNGGQDVMGGGIYNTEYSNPVLTNVTIVANFLRSTDAQMLGVGMRNNNSSPIIKNSIFWENRKGYDITSAGVDIENAGTVNLTLKNTITQGYNTGNSADENKINVNPNFVNIGAKNFRLSVSSPAIDAGHNAFYPGLNADSKDMAGNPRVFDFANSKGVDMGAYEYQCIPVDYSIATLEDVSAIYDGHTHGITVQNLPQGVSAAYEITDSLSHTVEGNTAINAGIYTVTATISPAVSGVDCTPEIKTATLTIRKAAAVITADSVQRHVYDGTLKNVTASLNHTEAVLDYSPQQGYTNLGVYPVTVSVPETDNYLAATKTVMLVIENTEFTGITLNDSAFVYDGTPRSLAISGTLPEGTAVAYSGNEKTDAGVYSVNAWIKNNNYQDLWLRAELTIHKAPAVITADSVQTFVYDGTVKNVQATLNHSDTVLNYSPQQGYTAAGTYPVVITAGETANYLSAVDTVTLVITNPDLGITLEDSSYTYDGTPKFLAIKGDLPPGGTVSYSGNGKINAGVYTVEALIQVPNYSDVHLSATLTIEKAEAMITADQTQTFTYDGTGKKVVAALNHSETALVYSPQQGYTASGTYPVVITASETSNYLPAADTVSLVIQKASFTGLALADSTFTFDGTPRLLLITGTLPPGADVAYTNNARTNAGMYTVEALVTAPHYHDLHLEATLTIEKAEAVITADTVQHFTYDGTEKKVTASLNHSETALVYTPQQGYTAAGTYEVIITAAATGNYLSAVDTVSLVIESAGLSGISFKDSTVTYDGTARSLLISGTLPHGGTVSYTGNGKTDAGRHTIEALIQVPNYSDVRLSATLTIAKAPALITADPTQTFTYNGTVQNVVASLNHNETVLTYAPQQGYTAAGTYTVFITASETANYLTTADTVSLVIESAGLSGISFKDSTFTYDGTPKSLLINGTLPQGGSVSYTGNGKIDAGIYTVEALIQIPNYSDVRLSATLTIRKAEAMITADQTQTFTYDDTEKKIVASLNHSETSLTYAPQQGYTGVGSYPIILTAAETTNYLAAADTVTLVIESATLTGVTLPDGTFIYDGASKSLAVSGSLPPSTTLDYTGNGKTDGGVYTVTALVRAPNYRDLNLSGTLTIKKAQAVITAGQTQVFTYDGTEKKVAADLNHSETTLAYTPQQGYTAAGTYTIFVSAVETANYQATADTVSLVIESAGLAGISFKDSTVTYDGTSKSLLISGTLPQGATVAYTGNGKTGAGIYTVEALIQVPNYSDVRLSATLTIAKAPALITSDQIQTFTYDGTVKNVQASLNHSETALVYTPQQGYSAVGTYPIVISAPASTNYLATADTVKLVVENQSVTGLVLKDSTFTYDGTPKSLVVSGTLPAGATVSYTGNAKANAGEYTVTARIEAPGVTPVNLSGTLTIEKAQALITADTLQSFMYDGTVKNVVATLNHTETSLTYAPQKGYSALGSYVVRISAEETANYLSATDTVRLVIEKADWKDIVLKDSVFTYDGKVHALAVNKLPQGATVVYTNNGKTDAGIYKVSATVSMENYKDSVLTATLTILKAAAVITAKAVQEHTADGSLKQVVASLNHQETSLVYTPSKGYSQAGSYPITVSAAETKNYKAASVKVTLVIQKATFQGVSMSGAEYTYDGTAHYLYVSGVPEGTRITYSGNGQSQSGTYTVRALLQKENYNDLELSATLVIRKAQSVIWTDAVQSHVYDGTLKAVQAWLNHSEAVLSYSPKQGYTDAGTYDIRVSAPETRNYLAASTPVRLFIDKARFEGVSLADREFTYNGTPHSLRVSGAPAGATVTYTGNSRTNAGTYRVNALVQMKNYYDLELSATLVIHKAPQYITFDDIELKHLEEDSDFQLMAHSSSGLPVSYTYTYDAEEAPATVTPAGWVELHTSGYVQIIAYQEGNENYLPAETVTRQLKINSSDATVHRITLGGEVTEAPDTDIYYLMDCGDEREELQVQLKTEVGATVVPGRDFTVKVPTPGIYTQSVVITSQDSTNTLTYQITIEKRFKFEQIGVQKFNNLFLINNNPETNGGYEFVEYEWYKNGELVGNGQYYSAGGNQSDVLDGQASYSVRMKTADGQWLSVCAFSYRPDASFTLSISPNPIISGNRLRLKVSEGGEARVRVLTSAGVLVLDQRIKDSTAGLTLPSELSAGTYILHYENGNIRKSVQFVLEK